MDDETELSPRPYQAQLMQIASKQNTIIYLPTGSGKTFIGIMLLKHLHGQSLESYSNGGKISFILVNSVALVDQHAKYVKEHSVLKAGAYSGERNVDSWDQEKWKMEYEKHNVLVMTSQILLNIITNSFIDLRKVNLIIFDECHRGVEDHAMRQIMKKFQNLPTTPRILGLTATLLNGNCKLNKVMDEVKSLESTYNSKVATVDGLEAVVGFSTNPKEMFKFSQTYHLRDVDNEVIAVLNQTLEVLLSINPNNTTLTDMSFNLSNRTLNLEELEPNDILKRLRNLVKDLINHIEMLGTFGAYKSCVAFMIQIERVKRHCDDPILCLILNHVLTTIGWAKQIFKTFLKASRGAEQILANSSDKVLKLIEIFREYKTKSQEELCCLVFVKQRFTAKILHHILQDLKTADASLAHLKSNFIVGNNNNPYNASREMLFISKKNKEVLDTFINKEINVLFSSNVLEEGVDIPKCTLVVKFDKAEEYRSYIQSKGRARHKSSLYYTIVELKDREKFENKYQDFKKIEQILNDLLIGQNDERDGPFETDMLAKDLLRPYYANGPNSASVDMLSAISLLCRYCQSLSGDLYTSYAPEWYLDDEKKGSKLRVVILLPLICPILEPIKGDFMQSKKNAKRAAALKACIILHQCGELDNNLLPISKTVQEEDISFLFKNWPEVKQKEAGNKKVKRLHDRQISKCVQGPIQGNQTLFLHVIKLNPQFSRNAADDQRVIYDMFKTSLCFGLLTADALPSLCKFPLYDSYGTIEVEIKFNAERVTLSNDVITQIREFHYLIFNDLLEILKPFLIFDNSGTNSEMMLLVPIQDLKKVKIDFEVLHKYKQLKNKSEATAADRINLEVTEETYLHKIISPWYRPQPTMYLVMNVCMDKNANSDFPNQEYPSFVSYYQEKHNLNVLNPDQPLLLVKGLPKRLNNLMPRGWEAKRKKEKRYEELQEQLLPELVIKQEFPACLWIQARFLPSVVSRLTFLLKLHVLQYEIARSIDAKEYYLLNCPSLELDLNRINYVPADFKTPVENTMAGVSNENYIPIEAPPQITHQYNKDYSMRMLESEYGWKNIDEPKDIERELNITSIDVQFYENFISVRPTNPIEKSPVRSPKVPALTYKNFEEKPLKVLRIKYDRQIPNLCTFYQALTTAEARDVVNLERLETLGDSFLKLIASMYIMMKFPNYNEGKASSLKGKLVSNKNLFYLAQKKNLGGILKNSDLSPKEEWVPPCFCIPQALKDSITKKEFSITTLFSCVIPREEQISGNVSKKTLTNINVEKILTDDENCYSSMAHYLNKQYVSDKTMADVVEALLGAFLLEGGFECGMKFMEWIEILPESENIQTLIKTTNIDPVVNHNLVHSINLHLPQIRRLEEKLGYTFKNRAFLLQALTHSSYSPNRITHSYEKLEFIGDAVLDFLITCYIFEHCGNLDPGQVTDLRSALVNNNTFASFAVRCDFHKFLLIINQKLQSHIDKFADYLESKDYIIDDEVLILLEEHELNISEYVDVPKVLGDVFEALAGAVYLDSGKDLEMVWKVFYKIMWREIDLFSNNVPKNVIRRLYECNAAYPKFSDAVDAENGKTMVSLRFMCEGQNKIVYGFGTNKIMAKRAAAKAALRTLKA